MGDNGDVNDLLAACTITSANSLWLTSSNSYQPGFVTASHCLAPELVNNGDWVNQPNFGSAELIATEYVYPPGGQCGSLMCKYSDSSWMWSVSPDTHKSRRNRANVVMERGAEYNDAAERILCYGRRSVHSNSFVSAFPDRWKRIASSGDAGGKGRRELWLDHRVVIGTCTDLADNNGRKFVCNATAYESWCGPGDSGSPVFYRTLDAYDSVQTIGLLWGEGTPARAIIRCLARGQMLFRISELWTLRIDLFSDQKSAGAGVRAIVGDYNGDHRSDIALVAVLDGQPFQ